MSARQTVSLVTGGTGFVGAHLVEALAARGDQIRVIGRRPMMRWQNHPSICHLRADLGEPGIVEEALKGVDRVFHLAAATRGDWNAHRRVTIDGSARLLEAMAARGGGRIIFVSSLSVYDGRAAADGMVIDEDVALADIAAARSSYARAKSAADAFAQRYLSSETVALTIVRPGVVYGPGMRNPLTGVAISLRGMCWLATGERDKLLALIYIDDLVTALIRIAQTPRAAGRIFNLVDAAMPTHGEYLTLYREISGDRRPVFRLPLRRMIPLLGVLDWLMSRLIGKNPQTAATARRLSGRIIYSAERARRELGFESRTPVALGLRKVIGYNQ